MIEGFLLHTLIIIAAGLISALGFNLIVGYTGQLNLGFIALFAFGAYTSAILTTKFSIPVWFGILAGTVCTGIMSVIIGLPTKNVKREYFHLASLGFIFILGGIAKNWISLTDGALGIKGIPRLAASQWTVFLIFLSVAIAATLVTWLLVRSHLGRIFQGIRDDELAVQSLGYNTYAYKLLAFALSGMLIGISGAMWPHYLTFIDPSIFNFADLILYLAIIIFGGLASLKGTIIGLVILQIVITIPRFIGVPSAAIGPVREMIFSAILLMLLLYRPKGLFGKVDLT